MNDFIKKAKEKGKIQKYKDICDQLLDDDCPEFYIGEKVTKYSNYKIGDIVFVKNYFYKNGEERLNHLFVIIDEDHYAVPVSYFCMLLSSRIDKTSYKNNILIKKDKINHLKKDSIVKTDTVYEFDNTDIEFCVGSIKEELVHKFIKYYMGDFNE